RRAPGHLGRRGGGARDGGARRDGHTPRGPDGQRHLGPGPAAGLAVAGDARHGMPPRPGSARTGGRAMRFLALGDSYTIGEGVSPGARWPAQLAARLRERGAQIAEPTIIARTGWTTDELASALDAAEPRGPYQLVSLLIGVNDQYRGREAGEYRGGFRSLLRRAIALAGGETGRVLVLSIPD